MIKKILFICSLSAAVTLANGQKIDKVQIEDVVKSFSANNDTVYVVNFWATFCKPCIAEIPDFIKLTDKYKKQKVKLLLVSLDLPTYYPAKIADFAKKNKYKTNIAWLNETNADHFCPMIDAKWSGAIPATIIVNNKNGYRKFFEDEISAADFEKALQDAIAATVAMKYFSPMNNAVGIESKIAFSESAGMPDFITFKSKDSAVYSITAGKVSTIARIEDMKIVIIEDENNFYTYSNLASTTLKTGDTVKANQLIGFALKDLDGDKPSVDLYKNDNKGNYIMLSSKDFVARGK